MSALPWEVKYMPVPKANQRAVNKYVKNNYDRINVTMPKGQKEVIQSAAAAVGESANSYINTAIIQRMERDTGGPQEATEPGVVSLPSKAIKTAQKAAEAAGEGLPQFVTRAIESRAALDKRKRG